MADRSFRALAILPLAAALGCDTSSRMVVAGSDIAAPRDLASFGDTRFVPDFSTASDAAVGDLAAPSPADLAVPDLAVTADLAVAADLSRGHDLAVGRDLAVGHDLAPAPDLAPPADLANPGAVTGGPCASGAFGATAFRLRWVDAGGQASLEYEVVGLPDKGGFKAGAYGYNFGFTPQFVDPFLGAGGLQLDDSDFVDVNLSTVGLAQINSVTLSIFGRSDSVDTSGSFAWTTFHDASNTPPDFVSNVAPYQWYSADVTPAFAPGDGQGLLRIQAGPSSDSLVVNRIELCMDAR